MNELYTRYQITSDKRRVSEADWFYVTPEIALDRGDIYIGQASITLAATATASLQMKTGADTDVYLIGLDTVTTATRITEKIIEAPTITDGTTELTMINMNRQSDQTPGFTVYTDPTSISGGTVIDQVEKYEAKKSPQSAVGGAFLRIKFKRSEDYVLSLVNGDNQQTLAFVKFYMLEI